MSVVSLMYSGGVGILHVCAHKYQYGNKINFTLTSYCIAFLVPSIY